MVSKPFRDQLPIHHQSQSLHLLLKLSVLPKLAIIIKYLDSMQDLHCGWLPASFKNTLCTQPSRYLWSLTKTIFLLQRKWRTASRAFLYGVNIARKLVFYVPLFLQNTGVRERENSEQNLFLSNVEIIPSTFVLKRPLFFATSFIIFIASLADAML